MKKYNNLSKSDYLTICQQLAERQGGKCLSECYVNTHSHLLWECQQGHIWQAMPSNIKQGKWCPYCQGNAKLTLDECHQLAKKNKGKCLSTNYINSSSLLEWQCQYGHIWQATYNNVNSKHSWCPQCASLIGEKICRLFFEQSFGVDFKKARPEWLLGVNGAVLELDGYNPHLKIAFEYQGKQHYQIDGFFVKNQQQLCQRIAADSLKKELCCRNNVILFQIPYFNKLDIEEIHDYLYQAVSQRFLIQRITLNLESLYDSKIEKYKELARLNDGYCMSDHYINSYQKLKWQCQAGHQWQALGYSIELGHWCPKCRNRK